MLQTDSKELLERYLLELSERQKYLDNYTANKGGSLQISVGYLMDKSVVEVSVIQARNLPGNGECCVLYERTRKEFKMQDYNIMLPIIGFMLCGQTQ